MKYPGCREVKYLLSGEIRTYDCELLFLDDDIGILRYDHERPYTVNNQVLPKNTSTFAFYWPIRPFTLYRWFSPRGEHLGDYFNIADRIHLNHNQFEWRDLIVDIFVSQQGRVTILDESELPADLDEKLGQYISQAVIKIIKNYKNILNETDLLLKELF